MRSPENIVDEMIEMRDLYNVNVIDNASDGLNYSLQWAKNVCEEIIRRKLNIPWTTQLRIDNYDEELLSLLEKSGCIRVSIGIESANQWTLDNVEKK